MNKTRTTYPLQIGHKITSLAAVIGLALMLAVTWGVLYPRAALAAVPPVDLDALLKKNANLRKIIQKKEKSWMKALQETEPDPIRLEEMEAQNEAEKERSKIDLTKLVDPFVPIQEVLEKPAPAPDEEGGEEVAPPVTLPPVQRVPLAQLELVAIIKSGAAYWAMVEDKATRTGYIVQVGSVIGSRKWKVSSISETRLDLSRDQSTSTGGVKTISETLKLRSSEDVTPGMLGGVTVTNLGGGTPQSGGGEDK